MTIREFDNMSIQQRKDHIMKLADEMAAAVTTRGPQGYESFLDSRNRLLDSIEGIGNIAENNQKVLHTISQVLQPQHISKILSN